MTRGKAPRGFTVDHLRHRLGTGSEDYERAKAALRAWVPFRQHWLRLEPATVEPDVGGEVAVIARVGPCWWLNACRVVYLFDEAGPPRQYGFAYGTLPDHAECGEERFCVELAEDGTVWYDLQAYSRPGQWLVWLGYPLTRRLQKKFATGSAAAMEAVVANKGPLPW